MTRNRLAIAAVVLVGIGYATLIQSFSWNQTSHYDLIRALDNGETSIDKYQENTGDKAYYKGHWYSARAPGTALFALPFYDGLKLVGAESWTDRHVAPPEHPGDEMVWLIGLWANVLPGALLVLLVWRVAERYEPGYGIAAAVAMGLGTLVLPLSTLLFSHMFTTMLMFAAFWLMVREREGPPSPMLLAVAGLAAGYAFSSEYPTAFAAVALGGYLLSRRDALNLRGIATRSGAYVAGGIVGIVPLGLYNHYAFGSWTHLAYSNIPRQKQGFFGIDPPSLKVLATLLLDSRGLLTISPVLALGALGGVLMYRRGRRAEALTIAGVCVCYLGYNSGYYLPFGGGFMGPRFLDTMLPFIALPVALALKRWPGPAVALAGVSIATTAIATITHPLVGYETETVVWVRFLREGLFQPTIASAYGLGRGWGGIWPFLVAAGGAIVLAAWATPRLRLSGGATGTGVARLARSSTTAGVLVLAAWCAWATLGPTVLGVDHAGLESIYKAGDHTALSTTAHPTFSTYPLKALAPIAAACGLIALVAMRLTRNAPPERRDRRRPGTTVTSARVTQAA